MSDNKANVYLRTGNKKASVISIPKTPSLNELKNIVAKKWEILDKNIILFLKGERMTEQSSVNIEDKNIIHVINQKRVVMTFLVVHVRDIENKFNDVCNAQGRWTVSEVIQSVRIAHYKQTTDLALVYVGKQLDPRKTLFQQLVQDGCQLICIPKLKRQAIQSKSTDQKIQQNQDISTMGNKIPDPLFDLMMDKDLEQNQWPTIIDTHKQNLEHQSLMAKSINKELFEKLKDHKTPNGWTISRAINSGTLYPESFIGCHAGDLESYHEFKEFFYPVIEGCHFGFKMDGSMKHETDIDSSKIQTKLTQTTLDKVISTRIRCARNLKMIPLNTVGTKDTRIEVLELIKKVVAELPVDLQGELLPLEGMSEEKRKELIDAHFLFRGGDKMQAASGYHAFWPSGRGIFLSHDQKFMMWINQGDHLRIISMEKGGDIQSVFDRFSRAVTIMEATIKKITKSEQAFLSDPIIGMIACCPSNLGTCMRGSVHILLPKLIKKIGFKDIDKIARKLGCQARGSTGEHSEVIDRIDISNWRRLGFPEYRLVEDMMKCANELAKMEEEC